MKRSPKLKGLGRTALSERDAIALAVKTDCLTRLAQQGQSVQEGSDDCVVTSSAVVFSCILSDGGLLVLSIEIADTEEEKSAFKERWPHLNHKP